VLTLLRRSFGRVSRMWIASILLLAGFQVGLTSAAVSLQESGDFGRLFEAVPAFVRNWLGPSLSSFSGMTALVFFEPLVILLLVLFAVYIGSELAGDVEDGLVDLILARPMPRYRLVTRSLLVITVTALTLVVSLAAANVASVALMAPDGVPGPPGQTILNLSAHLFALTWCFGGVTLAVAARLERRSTVLGVLTIAVIALFLLKVLVETSTRFERLRWITPFDYFQGTKILLGTAPVALDLTVLGALGLAGTVIGYWQFARRDL
jgi:ABC-2 type transport system permease protein